MSDLISRQAAIETIQKVPNAGIHWFISGEAVLDALLKLPSAQPRWIPVAERLPENYEDVLVTIKTDYKGYKVRSSYYSHGYFHNDNGDTWSIQDEPLLAWMPQPTPYKEEQRWIPISERLPKVREWVLCQCRAGIMDVLRLTEDGDWDKNYPHAEYMSGFVVAWMPLPEPYKGE